MEYPELKKSVIKLHEQYPASLILIEDKSTGQPLIQELKTHTNISILGINILPGQNKIARASSCTGAIEAGRVFVPTNALWLPEFQKQLVRFSYDKELQKKQHDDIVDSVSQFINWWQGNQQIDYRGIYGY
jgi:predicted phage terminase large subunit-like protein